MEYQDYYAILCVDQMAPTVNIEKSYRVLSRKVHPDLSNERDASEKFKALCEAYSVLRDAQKRAVYDQLRKLGTRNRDGSFSMPANWHPYPINFTYKNGLKNGLQYSEFYRTIFGLSNATDIECDVEHQPLRGKDVYCKVQLTLEEATNGCVKKIHFEADEKDEFGKVVRQTKTPTVKFPKSLERGQLLCIKGRGEAGLNGAERGDLFIEIEYALHPFFTVQGRDIYLRVPISPWEAALGAKITVPGLTSSLSITIPKGAICGQKFRLKGKGLTGKIAGDLIILLSISLPKSHDYAALALYRQLSMLQKDFNPRTKFGALT